MHHIGLFPACFTSAEFEKCTRYVHRLLGAAMRTIPLLIDDRIGSLVQKLACVCNAFMERMQLHLYDKVLDKLTNVVYRNVMSRRKIQLNSRIERGVALAVKAMGSRYALSKALGLTHAACQKWTHIPAERVLQVEEITGVDRTKLRPDLYKR